MPNRHQATMVRVEGIVVEGWRGYSCDAYIGAWGLGRKRLTPHVVKWHVGPLHILVWRVPRATPSDDAK